ncbi:MAG: hypothetical protein HY565_04480 [Candidatus Kerfeldbacteria bacterium]|nr:hypothetical protein [Candidatus Kerfeldbacteria bacterium]
MDDHLTLEHHIPTDDQWWWRVQFMIGIILAKYGRTMLGLGLVVAGFSWLVVVALDTDFTLSPLLIIKSLMIIMVVASGYALMWGRR